MSETEIQRIWGVIDNLSRTVDALAALAETSEVRFQAIANALEIQREQSNADRQMMIALIQAIAQGRNGEQQN